MNLLNQKRMGAHQPDGLFQVSLSAYLTSVGEGDLAERICPKGT